MLTIPAVDIKKDRSTLLHSFSYLQRLTKKFTGLDILASRYAKLLS